jgi:hypothetical protein
MSSSTSTWARGVGRRETRIVILVAVLAATAWPSWPALSSLWTNPGKQGPDIALNLPPLAPTTTTTYPVCNILPETQPPGAPPVIQDLRPCIAPTTAVCRDGTKTHVVSGQGACSGHGGVAQWLQ